MGLGRGLILVLGAGLASWSCGEAEESTPGAGPSSSAETEPGAPETVIVRDPPVLEPDELAPAGEAPGASAGSATFVDGAEQPAAELAPESSCAATVVQAEAVERVIEIPVEEEVVVPSVFYLMLDSSGSMVSERLTLAGLVEAVLDIFGLGRQSPAPTKWDFAVDGLNSFFSDPASAGLPIALGYFPDGGACDGSGYDQPAVPLAALPENQPPLQSSLDARDPDGNTPLEGALRGATSFCQSYNAEHPDESCVAVLITDGAGDQCDARSGEALAEIAASAAASGVLTFAAGMQGADFSVLEAIGQAGGGDCDPATPSFACDLTADSGAFVAALNGIRDRTRTQTRIERRTETVLQRLPCEWEVPAPPPGATFEPGRVNVRLTSPAGEEESLAQVPLAGGCADGGGWYYDDPLAPTRLLACPATCEELRAETETRVDVLFGCRTVLR